MTKFRRMYKQEGESEEEYSERVKQHYDELFQSNEGKEIAKQFMQRIYQAQEELKSERKKIIELTKPNDSYCHCLICGDGATTHFNIVRPNHGDNVISFNICDKCLSQMQQDIEARQ